jgi:hypothetical protein
MNAYNFPLKLHECNWNPLLFLFLAETYFQHIIFNILSAVSESSMNWINQSKNSHKERFQKIIFYQSPILSTTDLFIKITGANIINYRLFHVNNGAQLLHE